MNATVATFDASRARLQDKPSFEPFYVRRTVPLAEALRAGRVDTGDHLLVAEQKGGVLALDVLQMSYHHVAQGELAGDPWLVTF